MFHTQRFVYVPELKGSSHAKNTMPQFVSIPEFKLLALETVRHEVRLTEPNDTILRAALTQLLDSLACPGHELLASPILAHGFSCFG